jgi:hypothetical protein
MTRRKRTAARRERRRDYLLETHRFAQAVREGLLRGWKARARVVEIPRREARA